MGVSNCYIELFRVTWDFRYLEGILDPQRWMHQDPVSYDPGRVMNAELMKDAVQAAMTQFIVPRQGPGLLIL